MTKTSLTIWENAETMLSKSKTIKKKFLIHNLEKKNPENLTVKIVIGRMIHMIKFILFKLHIFTDFCFLYQTAIIKDINTQREWRCYLLQNVNIVIASEDSRCV